MYRTYLFGHPAIIATSPALVKFVLHSDSLFPYSWPQNKLMGSNNLVATPGPHHALVRRFLTASINQPSALKRIGLLVQPRMVDSLRSWAENGTVTAFDEVKKVNQAVYMIWL